MDVAPFTARIAEMLKPFVGFKLTKATAFRLQMDLAENLREAVTKALAERPCMLRAADLRGMGITVPENIPDRAFVPCAPTGDAVNGFGLRLELSYLLPAEQPAAEGGEPCPST